MRFLVLIFVTLLYQVSFSQPDRIKIADSITIEGIKLYNSEMASWYGTDVFMEKGKSDLERLRAYFSYSEGDIYKCIFYSKDINPVVLGTIIFKGSFDPREAIFDSSKRSFTETELQYYLLRKVTEDEISNDTSLFLNYENTNLNIIPLIEKNSKKVYILTGTSRSDIVIIGNDYLLTFDENNKLITKNRIHANIITLPTKVEEKDKEGNKSMGNVHNHVPQTGEYITATDICTFMLYGRFSNWKQQIVISQHYMSIWNCETNKLIIVPTGR